MAWYWIVAIGAAAFVVGRLIPRTPPGPPEAPAFILTESKQVKNKSHWDREQLAHFFKCRFCGTDTGAWAAWAVQPMNYVTCPHCGARAHLHEVQKYMRHVLKDAKDETCVNCGKEKEAHAGDKCLFEATEYKPRGSLSA